MSNVTPENWTTRDGANDCPQCGDDSKSARLVGDGVHEWRQCFDNPAHEFQAVAYYKPDKPGDATVFNLR